MEQEYDDYDDLTPIRTGLRTISKTVEAIAVLSGVAVILKNIGIFETASTFIANTVERVLALLPNLFDIVVNLPLPGWIANIISKLEAIQDISLLLNLSIIWAAARLVSLFARIIGARRGKIENIVGLVTKLVIVGVLLSEGVNFLLGNGTIDAFRGLIPFLTEKGGDVSDFLVNSQTRERAWAISSAVGAAFVAGWGYISNIRPLRRLGDEDMV